MLADLSDQILTFPDLLEPVVSGDLSVIGF